MAELRGNSTLMIMNNDRKDTYIEKIEDALRKCRLRKSEFATIQKFRAYMEIETGIHKSNLKRNKVYSELLEKYLEEDLARRQQIALVGMSLEDINKRNLELELTCSNLNQKLKQMEALNKKNIAKLKSELVISKNDGDYYQAFVDTSMALAAVLDRQSDIMTLNLETNSIEQRGGRSTERVIVGAQRLNSYISWKKEHEELLLQFMGSEKK